jgi:hypothetical protein
MDRPIHQYPKEPETERYLDQLYALGPLQNNGLSEILALIACHLAKRQAGTPVHRSLTAYDHRPQAVRDPLANRFYARARN